MIFKVIICFFWVERSRIISRCGIFLDTNNNNNNHPVKFHNVGSGEGTVCADLTRTAVSERPSAQDVIEMDFQWIFGIGFCKKLLKPNRVKTYDHRFSIKGCVYPAILPVENKKVNGKVLSGITVPELDILDKFEDVEYERRTVDVSLTDGCNTLMVQAYVWADRSDPNLYGEWDFEEWERLHKQSFLKMTMEFLEEVEKPDQSGST